MFYAFHVSKIFGIVDSEISVFWVITMLQGPVVIQLSFSFFFLHFAMVDKLTSTPAATNHDTSISMLYSLQGGF